MLEVKFFNDSQVYIGSFARVSDNVVSITGVPAVVGGFTLSREGKADSWNYADYSTIYREVDNTIFFSNDGSKYIEPVKPTQEVAGKITWQDMDNEDGIRPEKVIVTLNNGEVKEVTAEDEWAYSFGMFEIDSLPKVETVDIPSDYEVAIYGNDVSAHYMTVKEAIELKVAEINQVQQQIIAEGVDVELQDGSIERFTLTTQDQSSLEGLAITVAEGTEFIPWHNSNEGEQCKYYTNADMQAIIKAATAFVTYHVTYFRDLRIYVRSLTTKEEVTAVQYGIEIPAEHQSAVLKDLLAMMALAEAPVEEQE